MTTSPESPQSDRKQKPSARRGPGTLFWIFLTLVIAGLLVFFAPFWIARQGMKEMKETAVEVVKVFQPTEIVTTFNEWRELDATATDGNILEIATAESTERFTRTTNVAMFGKVLPLTTTISEITVPATYRFHINLNEEWNVLADGNRFLVQAPAVRPSLPVAFNTGGVQKKTQSGWARWDGAEHLAALEQEVTGKLAERAQQPATIEKIREEGRVAVAQFVQKWLLNKDAWGKGRFEEIVVVFAGEEGKVLTSEPAALRFDTEKSVLP